MTLWDLERHQTAIIRDISKNIQPAYAQRLRDFGFREGQEVMAARRSLLNGPRVYQVSGSFVALEKELAEAVQVQAGALG